MTLRGRIAKAERALGPAPDEQPTVAIVMEDETGQWWQNGHPVDRETHAARHPRLELVFRLIRVPRPEPKP